MEIDNIVFYLLNGSDSLFLDRFAVAMTNGLVWILLYIMLAVLVIKNNKTMSQILLIFFCGILGVILSGVFSDLIIKPLVMRPRPCFDPVLKDGVQVVADYNVHGYSFFSSHAANTFSLAVFFILLVRSKLLSVTLLLWTLLNCWTRVYLGVHWFTDVLAGMLWGGGVGILMYMLYYKVFYKISPKVKYVSGQYTSSGYSYIDIDMCISVIVFTILYGIIKGVTC